MENKISKQEVQEYVTDYWETFSKDEKALAIAEGFVPPSLCTIIAVDFVNGLGEIGRWQA